MYNGAQVPDATVTFLSSDPSVSGAFGRTDDQGRYTMQTGTGKSGVAPGEYDVTIVKIEFSGGEALSEDDPNYNGATNTESKPTYLVPKKYAEKQTTDLKATVAPGTNEINFELKD
ncbi:hypothetical protein GC197_05635 [bacterium]|nr:hypothetical protein [bacterium]